MTSRTDMEGKVLTHEEARLASLGRDQTMKRNFNVWSLIFMGFCTSVTWEVISATMAQSLMTGGSSSIVWGFFASAIGAVLIALSLSEYASMIPTAGGQYHYVAALSPPCIRRFLSWTAAWVTSWAWIAGALAGFFSATLQLQSWIILFNDGYIYQRWHTSLILVAITTWCAVISIVGIKWIHRLTFLGITIHIVGFLTTAIYLLVNVHPKNTTSYVFTDLTNNSGWKSDGVAWSIGLMGSALSLTNWDASMHMAEEMKNASKDLPRTIWGCVLLSGIVTFPWVISVMYCITDIQGVLNGPVGSMAPFPQLIYNVSGGKMSTTIGVSCFNTILSLTVAGPSVLTATSRIVWSFAVEGALPAMIAEVNPYFGVPVNAIVLVTVLISGMSFIYVGNTTAFYSISSGVTVVMIFSYTFPIMVSLAWGGQKKNGIQPGPFQLGWLRTPINLLSVCWSLYLVIFMCFPSSMPATKENMNYSVVILVFPFVFSLVSWFLYGRLVYKAPFHETAGLFTEGIESHVMNRVMNRVDESSKTKM